MAPAARLTIRFVLRECCLKISIREIGSAHAILSCVYWVGNWNGILRGLVPRILMGHFHPEYGHERCGNFRLLRLQLSILLKVWLCMRGDTVLVSIAIESNFAYVGLATIINVSYTRTSNQKTF